MNSVTYITAPLHYKWVKRAGMLILSLMLVSCGGSSFTPSQIAQPPVEQGQGGFQSISNRTVNTQADIQSVINAVSGGSISVDFAVTTYKLEYLTLDQNNELVKVSGLLAVPEKNTPSPILSYQHATIFKNSDAPTAHLLAGDKSIEIALASLGYIVFSADYVGYGSSLGRSHPYLLKKPSADVVLDFLQAGKQWLDFSNIETTNQLFMTGYSQGGYVTMAALKELQENPRQGMVASAVVMGAGPYDLHTALDIVTFGINVPEVLRDRVIDELIQRLVPSNEISFDRTFLERLFDNDRQDDVHNWRPDIAIKLFHGEDDRVVPIKSAENTVDTMQILGADVELVRCSANPSTHLGCVVPYISFVVNYFDGLRQ